MHGLRLHTGSLIVILALLICGSASGQETARPKIVGPGTGSVVYRGKISIRVDTPEPLSLVSVQGDVTGTLAAPTDDPKVWEIVCAEVGPLTITATAITPGGQVIVSDPVRVHVEARESSSLIGIRTSIGGQPQSIKLPFPGATSYLQVWAEFSNDKKVLVSRSSWVGYQVFDSSIVSIDGTGRLTAHAPGRTLIAVEYQGAQMSVPVLVSEPIRGDFDNDGDVDLDDISFLSGWLNSPVVTAMDARDVNGDHRIDGLDTRVLTTLCTRLRCARN